MRIRKIGHVVLRVSDLERMEAFYTGVLDFEVASRFEQPRAVFLTLGEQHHDIALFEAKDGSCDEPPAKDGLDHVGLQVESIEELRRAYVALKRHGVTILRGVDHGTTNSIYFCDPAGNNLELYCDVGTDGLARARSRLARSLDDFTPLDLESWA